MPTKNVVTNSGTYEESGSTTTDNASLIEEVNRLTQLLKPAKYANGYPFAMFAFGLSTVLIGQNGIRLVPHDSVGVAQGLWFAGVGQSLAGIFAFCNKHTLGTFYCFLFASWWYCFTATNLKPVLDMYENPSNAAFAYNIVWALFLLLNCGIAISFLWSDFMSTLTMTLVTVCATCFALASLVSSPETAVFWGGVTCTMAGCCAAYIGASAFLFEMFGRQILPLGFPKRKEEAPQPKTVSSFV